MKLREIEVKGLKCIEITVYVKPKASKRKLIANENELVFFTAQPPEKGRANSDLLKYISKLTGISQRNIAIIRGERQRVKILRICGAELNEFVNKIARKSMS